MPQGESSPVLTTKPDVMIEVTNFSCFVVFMQLTFQSNIALNKWPGVYKSKLSGVELKTLCNNNPICANHLQRYCSFKLKVMVFKSVGPMISTDDSEIDKRILRMKLMLNYKC